MTLRPLFALSSFGFFVAATVAACGGESPPPALVPVTPATGTPAPSATTAQAAPPPKAPPMRGLAADEESSLNREMSPCEDFFEFACGGWLKKTEIPADESSWMRSFSIIREQNEDTLRLILQSYGATDKGAKLSAASTRLRDFYASCMDESTIEKAGATPLEPDFKLVDGIRKAADLAKVVGKLHARGGAPIFGVSSQQDFADSTKMVGIMEQAGIGMPDRDYYLSNDGKFPELRKKYEAHMTAMFALLKPAALGKFASPAEAAKAVMALETRLATSQMTKEERREPKKIYHLTERGDLAKLVPGFPWEAYLAELPVKQAKSFNVAQPEYMKAMGELVQGITPAKGAAPPVVTLDAWKMYLKWHVLRAAAPALSKAFVDEGFKWQSALRGAASLPPRWKRCVRATDAALGEELAQPFVEKTLGADGKTTVRNMVVAIEAEMKKNLDGIGWMDAKTRELAHKKLEKIANKIAYPDKWRSYDPVKVNAKTYFANIVNANTFEQTRQLEKIGKPVDRNEWYMTPPTVNAYYDPSMNEMVFPAGILQPPFFGNSRPLAANFGGIGMVMGHELTHGFDDEGRQFDADGNLKDWWSPSVNAEFEKRASCVEQQFNDYVVNGTHVNGKLTLGENIADLGGVKLALSALKQKKLEVKEGDVTPEQHFFLGFAQGWCGKYRDEMMRLLIATNPHSPPALRVNGPLSNLPEFARAFSCAPGHKMVRANRCEVW